MEKQINIDKGGDLTHRKANDAPVSKPTGSACLLTVTAANGSAFTAERIAVRYLSMTDTKTAANELKATSHIRFGANMVTPRHGVFKTVTHGYRHHFILAGGITKPINGTHMRMAHHPYHFQRKDMRHTGILVKGSSDPTKDKSLKFCLVVVLMGHCRP